VLRFVACGRCPVPYNVDLLEMRPGAEVLLCEGETDTLAAVSDGEPVAIGSPGAGAWKRRWCELLRGRRVVCAFDPDREGQEANGTIADWLEADGQPRPPRKRLPPGMDLSDYLAAGPPPNAAPVFATASASAGVDAEALREDFEERAAIMEYDGGLPRAEAEAAAHVRYPGDRGYWD
jgi:hypothetical protein